MKKQSIIFSLCILASVIIITFTACKKKEPETTTPTPDPVKTLNKTTIQNILWQNKGGSIKHEFKSNGTYRFDGTWKWVRSTSDTMEIVMSAGDPKTYWKVYYNTEHEMSCEKAGTGGAILYKDQAW